MNVRKWGCKVCKYHYRDGFLSGQSKTYDNIQKLSNEAKASSFSFDLTIPDDKVDSQNVNQQTQPEISDKQKFQLNQIKEKFAEFANNQETIPQSYMDVLTRNFWDLL